MARRIMTLMKPIARQAFSPKYLLYTNAALGVGFMGAADTIQQKFEEIIAGEKIPLDLNRTSEYISSDALPKVATMNCCCFHRE